MKNQVLELAKQTSAELIHNSAYTKELKERRRNGNALFRGMYLHEVFHFFEEIICEPMFSTGERFVIHSSDIEEGGKFEDYALYSIRKFIDAFQVTITLG